MDYITSEQYNLITNDIGSQSLIPSTSTIFYDLDDIAKKLSFHGLAEINQFSSNLKKGRKDTDKNNIVNQINRTVQECATNKRYPKLLVCNNIESAKRKTPKKMSKQLSTPTKMSLKDYNFNYERLLSSPESPQKLWSLGKYRTEITTPKTQLRNTENEKRVEDPCPCQLFSHTYPCSDDKYITELEPINKAVRINQYTSTIIDHNNARRYKLKKQHHDLVREDKRTNTSVVKMMEVMVSMTEQRQNNQDRSQRNRKNEVSKNKPNNVTRKIKCPRCNEIINVVITDSLSTTTEEEDLKNKCSMAYHLYNKTSLKTPYNYRISSNDCKENKVIGAHLYSPLSTSEMLTICNMNEKSPKNSERKAAPRVIRITKACRHYPPCKVVPSCQRANIINNKCENIPPCAHHPHCINLPLCAPFNKSLHYEETSTKLVDKISNFHLTEPRCKYISNKRDSLTALACPKVNIVSRVQNENQFLKNYKTPKLSLSRQSIGIPNSFILTHSCQPCKSCQFDCVHCERYFNEELNNDTVIFIRDVGCQFKDKSLSPKITVKGSLPINYVLKSAYTNCFEFVNGKYYLKQEQRDTSTNPISDGDFSLPTVSLDSKHPVQDLGANKFSLRKSQTTGFLPHSSYLAAFSSVKHADPTRAIIINQTTTQDSCNRFPISSRRSFFKGKHKIFSIKRRRKGKYTNSIFGNDRRTQAIKK